MLTQCPMMQVLDKLQNKILPDAKQMLTKVGRGEGSNYPASIAKARPHSPAKLPPNVNKALSTGI